MRNLKRALSLALASVMLLGMMVVGTGASYADVDSADNVEAIEVLQAVNVMSGDDKGNFNPDQVVTRAEMAVIICKMLYGDKLNVSQFAGANVFSDVPAWAQGFVNLAASLDIVAGVGDGKFAPNEPVTTAQATLMLCKALGYFQNPKEFGNDWALAAITKGTQLDLFDDMVLGTHEGLTRNNVAELTFNALANAVPVEYNETFDTYYNAGRAWTYGVQFRYDDTLGYKNLNLVNQKDEDDFGRPGMTWGIGKYTKDMNGDIVAVTMDKEIVTETNEPIAVYTASMTKTSKANEVEKALKGYSLQAAPATGTSENTTYISTNGDSQPIANGGDTTIKTNIIDNTANGVTVEVYAGAGDENSAKIITDIVVIQPEKAEVAAINTTKGTVTLSGDYAVGSIVVEDDSKFYDVVKNLKVDDVVVVTVNGNNNNEVLDLYVPQTVTGGVTEVNITASDADKIAVVGGTTYTVSARCLSANNFQNALGETATVYLDKNGYALYVDVDAETVPNYMYLTNLWEGTTVEHGNPTATTYARGVNAEGEVITLEVANKHNSTANTGAVDATNFPGVTYGTSAGNAYAPTGDKATDGNIQYLTGSTASYGTIVEYKQSTVDPDLYVLVVPETGNTTAASMNEGVAAAVSTGLSNTAKKIGDAYLSTAVKFVFVNYTRTDGADATFTDEKLTASAVDGVQTVASGKDFYPVLWQNDDTGEIRIVTVFVADTFVNDQEVYYINGDSSYKTQYKDADGKTVTGYKADIYLNGTKMSNDVILTAPGTAGFYLLDEMDGEAMKLKGAGTYTTVEDSVAELYNSLLTAGSDSYQLDANTVYVDLTGDYEGISSNIIKNLIDRDYDVKVSVQFKSVGSDKVATYVYVTDVVAPDSVGLTASLTIQGTTAVDAKLYGTAAEAVAHPTATAQASGKTISITPTTDNTGATVSSYRLNVDYASDATNFSTSFSSGSTTTAANKTEVIEITVTAADGVTTGTYYLAFTVGA